MTLTIKELAHVAIGSFWKDTSCSRVQRFLPFSFVSEVHISFHKDIECSSSPILFLEREIYHRFSKTGTPYSCSLQCILWTLEDLIKILYSFASFATPLLQIKSPITGCSKRHVLDWGVVGDFRNSASDKPGSSMQDAQKETHGAKRNMIGRVPEEDWLR